MFDTWVFSHSYNCCIQPLISIYPSIHPSIHPSISTTQISIRPSIPSSSSETQRQSVWSGEKTQRKFSSTGGRAPGYRVSTGHFQTVKRMLACDCVNRRTASSEFFTCVRTRQLLSRHTCPVRLQRKLSFSNFLTRNEGTICD